MYVLSLIPRWMQFDFCKEWFSKILFLRRMYPEFIFQSHKSLDLNTCYCLSQSSWLGFFEQLKCPVSFWVEHYPLIVFFLILTKLFPCLQLIIHVPYIQLSQFKQLTTLSQYSRVLLEKLTFTHNYCSCQKNSMLFFNPECSLSCWKESILTQMIPVHTLTHCFPKIYINIILSAISNLLLIYFLVVYVHRHPWRWKARHRTYSEG